MVLTHNHRDIQQGDLLPSEIQQNLRLQMPRNQNSRHINGTFMHNESICEEPHPTILCVTIRYPTEPKNHFAKTSYKQFPITLNDTQMIHNPVEIPHSQYPAIWFPTECYPTYNIHRRMKSHRTRIPQTRYITLIIVTTQNQAVWNPTIRNPPITNYTK